MGDPPNPRPRLSEQERAVALERFRLLRPTWRRVCP